MNPKGHPATLKPCKPGEVRNPNGYNQFTYKRDAEQTFDRLLRSPSEHPGMTVAAAILSDLIVMARERDKWAIDKVLERILPAMQSHEVHFPGADAAALTDRLSGFTARKRTNGADREHDASGEACD